MRKACSRNPYLGMTGPDEPELSPVIFEPTGFADSLVALSVCAWARLTSVARRTRHRFLTPHPSPRLCLCVARFSYLAPFRMATGMLTSMLRLTADGSALRGAEQRQHAPSWLQGLQPLVIAQACDRKKSEASAPALT